MPEINQYVIENIELLEILIKQNDIHEGKWMLIANFAIAVGQFGQPEDKILPSVTVGLNKVGLQRASPDIPKEIVLDAAEINPLPKKSKTGAQKKAAPSKRRKKS